MITEKNLTNRIQAVYDEYYELGVWMWSIFMALMYFIFRLGMPYFPPPLFEFLSLPVNATIFKVLIGLVAIAGFIIFLFMEIKTVWIAKGLSQFFTMKYVKKYHFRPLLFIPVFAIGIEILIWVYWGVIHIIKI
jgi:hypothetical protein